MKPSRDPRERDVPNRPNEPPTNAPAEEQAIASSLIRSLQVTLRRGRSVSRRRLASAVGEEKPRQARIDGEVSL